MSKQQNHQPEEPLSEEPLQSSAGENPGSGAAGDATDATGGNEVAALRGEVLELKDKLLRSAADYQNIVRRSQQNVAEAGHQQLADVAKALIVVMDHFDRALEGDPAKVSVQSILQGVQIVHDELRKTLERFGIQRLEVNPGDEFNPKLHAALMHQKIEGVPAGRVAAMLQPGYVLNDRTLRPAQVTVAE